MENNNELEKLYSVKELTALGLGSRTSIYRYVKNGELTPIKLNHRIKFKKSDIDSFIERKRVKQD